MVKGKHWIPLQTSILEKPGEQNWKKVLFTDLFTGILK
jgi:hypothetical protein